MINKILQRVLRYVFVLGLWGLLVVPGYISQYLELGLDYYFLMWCIWGVISIILYFTDRQYSLHYFLATILLLILMVPTLSRILQMDEMAPLMAIVLMFPLGGNIIIAGVIYAIMANSKTKLSKDHTPTHIGRRRHKDKDG